MLIGHRQHLCTVSTELDQEHVDGHSKMVSGVMKSQEYKKTL